MPSAPRPPDDDQRVAALHRFGVLDAPRDPDLDGLTELAALVADTPVALVSLIDSARCVQASTYGVPRSSESRADSLCDYVVAEGRTIHVPDLREDARFADNPFVTGAKAAVRMYCGAPLTTSDGHTLGALCVVDLVPRELDLKLQTAVERLARQVVAVFELTMQSRRLASALALLDAQARRDVLTGLANRRELLDRLDVAQAAGEEVALLFCDLDRFKVVNDTHGHGVGDQVLVEVAARLQRQVRAGDLVARFGGDEFVVVSDVDGDGADELARRLEAALSRPYRISGGTAHVGVSVGVAHLAPGESVAAVLDRADAGMYREKVRRRGALPDQRRVETGARPREADEHGPVACVD